MKFLDLNGLKHLLGKIVKYDKGTSDVSTIHNLKVDNKIGTTRIQRGDPANYLNTYIDFSKTNTLVFKAGDLELNLFSDNKNRQDLFIIRDPFLEKIFPEEASTIKSNGVFCTIAEILNTLKEKGIM